MDFNAWCAARGIDPTGLTESVKLALQSTWRNETAPKPPPLPVPAPVPTPTHTEGGFAEQVRATEIESERVEYIQKRALALMQDHVGNPEKIKQIRSLAESATLDKKVGKQDFDLALIRLDHTRGPLVFSTSQPVASDDVLEAAVCMTTKLPGVEKQYSEQTLQAAHSRFRRGIGLQELLGIAAERNGGYRGSPRDVAPMCRAAFRKGEDAGWVPMQSVGPSTISVPGILSNVANKFLSAGFLFTEQAYRAISKSRTANDFKTMTSYRLVGNAKFQKIAPSGEIKHGTLSEQSYTNKVDPYGLMLGISYVDIRNDDLGAFTQNGQELGRGAGSELNEIFWAEFLDDSAFFTSGHGNLTQDTALAVLNEAGYDAMRVKFKTQTKEDGTPLGAEPRILLVSTGLEVTALKLMGSPLLVGGSSTVPSTNVLAGMTRVVSSAYLNATLPTLWYQLADPNDIPVIEVAYLDGKDTPTIETADFDFDRLGMAMRGTMHFGVSKQEYRGGQKSNGEAS